MMYNMRYPPFCHPFLVAMDRWENPKNQFKVNGNLIHTISHITNGGISNCHICLADGKSFFNNVLYIFYTYQPWISTALPKS